MSNDANRSNNHFLNFILQFHALYKNENEKNYALFEKSMYCFKMNINISLFVLTEVEFFQVGVG